MTNALLLKILFALAGLTAAVGLVLHNQQKEEARVVEVQRRDQAVAQEISDRHVEMKRQVQHAAAKHIKVSNAYTERIP